LDKTTSKVESPTIYHARTLV